MITVSHPIPPLPTAKIEPRVVSFAGIDATDTFLNLHNALTDRQERDIIAHLRSVIRGMPWWIGDFALYYRRKCDIQTKAEEIKARDEKRPPKRMAKFDDILAEAWDISAGHIRHAAALCEFFPVSERSPKLSFRHHYDAAAAAGGTLEGSKEKAKGWLKKAEGGGWSCADLRQHALPRATVRPPSTPEVNQFLSLDEADQWATQHHDEIKALDTTRAANLLVRLHGLAQLIDHLRALTGITGATAARINDAFAPAIATHAAREAVR